MLRCNFPRSSIAPIAQEASIGLSCPVVGPGRGPQPDGADSIDRQRRLKKDGQDAVVEWYRALSYVRARGAHRRCRSAEFIMQGFIVERAIDGVDDAFHHAEALHRRVVFHVLKA